MDSPPPQPQPPTEAPGHPSEGILARAFRHIDLEGHDLPPSPTPSSPRNGRKYAMATELVYTEHGDQYNSSSMPIYQVRIFVVMIVIDSIGLFFFLFCFWNWVL